MTADIAKLILLIVGVFLFFTYIARPFEPMDCRRNRIMSSIEVKGIIKQKFKNTKNNNADKIVTLNGSEFYWHNDFYGAVQPYKHLLIGDSIIKRDGSLEIEVYRADTSFTLNLALPCEEE